MHEPHFWHNGGNDHSHTNGGIWKNNVEKDGWLRKNFPVKWSLVKWLYAKMKDITLSWGWGRKGEGCLIALKNNDLFQGRDIFHYISLRSLHVYYLLGSRKCPDTKRSPKQVNSYHEYFQTPPYNFSDIPKGMSSGASIKQTQQSMQPLALITFQSTRG